MTTHEPLITSPVGTASPVRFDARYEGALPGFANGGVVAGTLVQTLAAPGATTVRLSRPVPLETTLLAVADDSVVHLRLDDAVLADVAPADASESARIARLADEAPMVGLRDARHPRPVVDVSAHPAPGCFVCGPAHRRGLDLQPGRIRVSGVVATVWRPPAEFAIGGHLQAPFVWAALDCPSWYGAAGGRPALLGTVVGQQFAPLPPDEPVVVTGWPVHRDGRKTHAGSALRTATGELIALAASTWIHPKEHLP